MPVFLALVGLLLAASVSVAVFAWQSTYADAAKLIIARWANAELPRPALPAAAPMSPELARRLQTMARDLANLEQRIEQLKTSQEQMVRDNTAVSEQLKAALAQIARDNAAVGEQLKASQKQLATMETFLASGLAQKPLPMRKPVPQAGAQPQVVPHLKPEERH
jgi:septal ring factor EnvC (AmiA/AmiB activator)